MYVTTLGGFGQKLTPEYIPEIGGSTQGRPGAKPEELGRVDLDDIYRMNRLLRDRVEDAARIVGLDPGFLAANLFAEKSDAAMWSGSTGTVASEILGLDDWFDPVVSRYIGRVIRDSPGINLKKSEVKKTGLLWNVGTEKAGAGWKPRGKLPAAKAVIATAVYIKASENMLRKVLANEGLGDALRYLTPEQRFTVLRVTFNAGVVPASKLVKRIRRGGDIPRTGKTTRDRHNAIRTAVLHMARGVHLSQAIFGRPREEYEPRALDAHRSEETRDLIKRLQSEHRVGKHKMISPAPP
jgi:hypothetical protein